LITDCGQVVRAWSKWRRDRRCGDANVIEPHLAWNYTTWLDLAFLALAAVLLVRFFRTGGVPMLRMMASAPEDAGHHGQHGHDHGPEGHQHH
jgi:hypothetical protein